MEVSDSGEEIVITQNTFNKEASAKLEGEPFFDSIPGLCQAIASMCTISCVTSLLTIAVMSFNRYIYICRHEDYAKIFTNRSTVLMCVSLYGVGVCLVLLNFAGVGDHQFDRKSVSCMWDRMATYSYTVFFSVVMVWIPSILTGLCYLRIFMYVRQHRRTMDVQRTANGNNGSKSRLPTNHLAKSLFLLYAVFITCWIPYALLIVLDTQDTYSHEIHTYVTVWAHLHPSLNWIIYYFTSKKFANAYRQILMCSDDHASVLPVGSPAVSQSR